MVKQTEHQSSRKDGLLTGWLTWWKTATIGTRIFTWRHGEKVGEDDAGNRYFRGNTKMNGQERRWVIYAGDIDASRVPPEWHAWLHHLVEAPPSEVPLQEKVWEKPHVPNLTGTDAAYVPPGSLKDPRPRSPATGDYEAWRPGS
ncbi:MAG: NADH:ubiquinone oxidoreductase subunit NDUFA12 [Pseudomonadota bacterium]